MIAVRLLTPGTAAGEAEAVRQWLERAPGILPCAGEGADCDVLWVHATTPLAAAGATLELVRMARPRGGLLLTGGAALLAAELQRGTAPAVRERVWRDAEDELHFFSTFTEVPRLRGHAGFRAHPLFAGLHGGAYTWRPQEGERSCELTHDWNTIGRARAVAMERAYIHINAERITAWEHHDAGLPPLLCIGAYLTFTVVDRSCRRHTERLTYNALQYAAQRCTVPARDAYWPRPGRHARHDDELQLPPSGTDRPGRISFASSPLRLAGGDPADPFTLAGRRAFAAGVEGSGVGELWVHPVRALRNLHLRGAEPIAAEITVLGIERTLRLNGVSIDERITVPHELGALVAEWECGADVACEIEWETDLRLMWPYPAGALGELRWRTHEATFLARATDTPDAVCCRFSRPPDAWQVEALPAGTVSEQPPAATQSLLPQTGPGPRLLVRAVFSLTAGESLRLVCAASSSGDDDLHATLTALRDPISLTRARTAALQRLQRDGFTLASPEPQLDAAVAWGRFRLDSFLVATPGVGRSLVAGYWQARPGWNEGRPGYAWYFGRDAVWTALAALAVGDFSAARDVIRFLGEKQDLTGKILHECTTSGQVHYDAADATPLYLLLVARHLAWTGETAFTSGEWECVRRALQFCLSTDTDGDELIENPGVGHGWIEFGPLGGGKVTYYNAGIWAAALRELASAAEDIGDRNLALELQARARRARQSLEERFYDPAGRRYALKAWQEEGEWCADFTPTATHAVPLLLGVADPERAADWFDLVASDEFSTDWGVRMIPRSQPLYNPRSYHGGAVWPLYTGWTAWAEYAAGREHAALRHLLSNAALAFERGKGAWDEVLHGSERAAVGVCPDQAWSAALTLAPLVYGLLGAEPDASRNRLRLRPQIPQHWDRLEARGLRLGENVITLRYERHHDTHIFRLEQEHGAAPVRVILEPVLHARALRAARVDGVTAQLIPRPFGGRLLAPVQLVLDAERVLELECEPPEQ